MEAGYRFIRIRCEVCDKELGRNWLARHAKQVHGIKVRTALTPWQKIIRAAKAGRGLRLSANEVSRLSFDDAIATVATYDDEHIKIDCCDE